VRVDAHHLERRRYRCRHRRAGDAGAAAEVDHVAAIGRGTQLADDVLHQQEMDGTVIHGKRRALAGAVERLVTGQRGVAAFDIRRRQRPQGPRHLAEPQVGQVPLFKPL
jgi:hypothetical protein